MQGSQKYYLILTDTACDEADKECFCSQKGSDACDSVSNSQCDSDSEKCVCNEDYYSSGGVCTAAPGMFSYHHNSQQGCAVTGL